MDEINTAADRERRIRGLMERLGVDEGRANFIVDLADGKTKGGIESDLPLTDEERERLGLGRSMLDLTPVADTLTAKQSDMDRQQGG